MKHNRRQSRAQVLLFLAGDGFLSTGVLSCLETFLRDMSRRQTEQLVVLTNNIASMQTKMQKQISELMAITAQTTRWMQDQQARSIESDKILRSYVQMLSLSSPHPCPSLRQKKAPALTDLSQRLQDLQASARPGCPLSLNPQVKVLVVWLFPARKGQKPSFSPAQNLIVYQQDDEFLRSAVLVSFPCGQNKNTIKKFCDDSESATFWVNASVSMCNSNEISRIRLAALEVDDLWVSLWTIPPFASMPLNHVQDVY